MLVFPQIDPIAFSLGPLTVHWYGLAYMAGFLAGLWHCQYLLKKYPLAGFGEKEIDALFIWIILGIVLGGRLGYVLFYELSYFINNPLEILKTWQGGMAFHGGLLGVVIALLVFCRRKGLHPAAVAERIVPGIPFGILFGRLANFLNGELWGHPTNVPWAMVFPHVDDLPRHPSQLYEAALEGIVLYLVIWFFGWRNGMKKWRVSGLFLVGYATARFFVEFFRVEDLQFTELTGIYSYLSQGQLLSIPMLIIGIWFLWMSGKHAQK